jgi:hypothetical protein
VLDCCSGITMCLPGYEARRTADEFDSAQAFATFRQPFRNCREREIRQELLETACCCIGKTSTSLDMCEHL